MPRYHFNIHDGIDVPDDEGTVLADLAMARLEAIRLSAAVLNEEAERLRSGESWHMEVVDSESRLLFRVDFRMTAPERVAAAE